jgi:hypothetical protein
MAAKRNTFPIWYIIHIFVIFVILNIHGIVMVLVLGINQDSIKIYDYKVI